MAITSAQIRFALGRVFKWVLYLLLAVFVLTLFGADFIIQIPFFLAFGWIRFLTANVEALHLNPALILEMLACAVALGIGSHYFARWIFAQVNPDAAGPWRARWTLAGLLLVLLLFVAGIGTIGITHQAAWMFSSDDPIIADNMGYSSRARVSEVLLAASGTRTAIAEFHERTGRLPDSGEEAGLTGPQPASRWLRTLSVGKAGVITAEVAETIDGGGTITLTPAIEGGTLHWTCRGTLRPRNLPADCRQ